MVSDIMHESAGDTRENHIVRVGGNPVSAKVVEPYFNIDLVACSDCVVRNFQLDPHRLPCCNRNNDLTFRQPRSKPQYVGAFFESPEKITAITTAVCYVDGICWSVPNDIGSEIVAIQICGVNIYLNYLAAFHRNDSLGECPQCVRNSRLDIDSDC